MSAQRIADSVSLPKQLGPHTLPAIPDHTRSVESMLMATIDLLVEPSRSGCRHIINAGGKRLRPDLVLAAFAGSPSQRTPQSEDNEEAAVEAAAAIELLHTATLVHDDFIDDSLTRRGLPTINATQSPSGSIIAGDALIAQSFRLMAGAGRDAVQDLAEALADMCAGQTAEEGLKFSATAEPFAVLRVSQLKTGALIRAACRIGARLGGLNRDEVSALGVFGSDFGVALQLVDDILDLVSDSSILGKPCGADFPAGTVTMPAVFTLDAATPTEHRSAVGRRLAGLLHSGLTDSDRVLAQELLISGGGVARTITLARAFARRAAQAVPEISIGYRELSAMPIRYVENQLHSKVSPQHQGLLTLEPSTTPTDEDETFLGMLGATG